MKSKRRYLTHGDIVEIHLNDVKSFAYAKVIDPKKIHASIEFPLILRVFRYLSQDSIVNVREINRELLLAPFPIAGSSAAITKFNWKVIVNETVTPEEEWLPDTKSSWPPFSEAIEKWGYFERFSTHINFAEYEKVMHLPENGVKNIEVVPFIIQMEILKQAGKDIKAFYPFDDFLKDMAYDEYSKIPLYSSLPEEMKGKAIK